MNVPLIRLEVEHMKQSMVHACSIYLAKMDEQIQAAVERECTVENVTRIIQNAAAEAITKAIKEEVDAFFRYGDGRKVINKAVTEQLGARVGGNE